MQHDSSTLAGAFNWMTEKDTALPISECVLAVCVSQCVLTLAQPQINSTGRRPSFKEPQLGTAVSSSCEDLHLAQVPSINALAAQQGLSGAGESARALTQLTLWIILAAAHSKKDTNPAFTSKMLMDCLPLWRIKEVCLPCFSQMKEKQGRRNFRTLLTIDPGSPAPWDGLD